MKKILLGLTTTPRSDWKKKIKEIDELGIKEIALFPTCIEPGDRKILYDLLEQTKLESIPHIHLRDDMHPDEVEFLIKRYKPEVFNLHPDANGLKEVEKLHKYRKQIFLENLDGESLITLRDNIEKCAGVCIDFSHWEAGLLQKEKEYNSFEALVKQNKIGCCHISEIKDKPREYDWGKGMKLYYSWHFLEKLENLDYLRKYIKYLPNLISIELENSFEEQLKIKKYIEEIIKT